ncbi:Hypothetical protein SRAE_2000404600 [Strongyloides ratti]|uniref:Uncharacterized protein n=1 Tax=Strongyloides ratti TaxID=34506 RepID=A0A090LI28_STRRB|nr:Hypothetical protein SRAE_2000404600 [Strongyloides ratti]CEF69397.1 Hypothetical protein SRAE_2000404600 [Strongyloides ratti]
MAVTIGKVNEPKQKIKKVLVLEWRQEEDISENEARNIINNFSKQKKVCQKHRNMITSSIKVEENGKSEKSISASPSVSKMKKVAKTPKSKSSKSGSKISNTKNSEIKKMKSKKFNAYSLPKEMNIKKTSTDIEIDKSRNVITRQKIRIPYKLFWKPTVTESGKEGITFKIQVQDLEGKKMELDVSCPNFMPNKFLYLFTFSEINILKKL